MSFPLALDENVLVPRRALQEGEFAERLTRQAKARAQHIVAQAQTEAHLIRRQAYADAYSDGLADALSDLHLHFKNAEILHADIQRQILEKFRSELENLLGNSDFLELLFEKWLVEQTSAEERKLNILLPPHLANQREKFTSSVTRHGGFTASVGIAPRPFFTIEHGEFVHEFDQQKFMDEMYPQVLACFDKMELAQITAEAARRSVEKFFSGLEKHEPDGGPSLLSSDLLRSGPLGSPVPTTAAGYTADELDDELEGASKGTFTADTEYVAGRGNETSVGASVRGLSGLRGSAEQPRRLPAAGEYASALHEDLAGDSGSAQPHHRRPS